MPDEISAAMADLDEGALRELHGMLGRERQLLRDEELAISIADGDDGDAGAEKAKERRLLALAQRDTRATMLEAQGYLDVKQAERVEAMIVASRMAPDVINAEIEAVAAAADSGVNLIGE